MKSTCLALALLACLAPLHADPVTIGERNTLDSKILGEERAYQVYLPPSYHQQPQARFPVLYMVDGDYHFHYVSALLEQMAVIGEQIPEMILIAIGDGGKKEYRRNMAPSLGEAGGEALRFIAFIGRELIPHVEGRYRTSSYRMLAGASMGGLFTVATLLNSPDLFDAYVAISPSLWWNERALVERAEKALQANPELEARLYLTLASERDMGVFDLVAVLDRLAPRSLEWQFVHNRRENHGSTGLPSLRWALLQEFYGDELTDKRLHGFTDPDDFLAHYRRLKDRTGDVLLPQGLLARLLHVYQRDEKPDQIEALETGIATHLPDSLPVLKEVRASMHLEAERWSEALALYRELIATHPQSFAPRAGAALAHLGLEQRQEAVEQMEKAVQLAAQHGARQWQLNQLEADLRRCRE